jgi:glycosyltransferase involved in cell wall biosynthesis
MKNCIFHIPWKVDELLINTPDIRVVKMLHAFKKIGYNVEVISGYGKERKKKIVELKERIRNGMKLDFVYSEASTYPTLLTESHHLPINPFLDFHFFQFCKKYRIPVGIFYRDIFWRFKEIKRFNYAKHLYSKIFHIYDLMMYKKLINYIFLPNENMIEYIKYLKKIPYANLYSGTEIHNITLKYDNNFLYVGGINPNTHYNISLLLKSFYKTDNILYICCREYEWLKFKEYYAKFLSKNIKIVHYNNNQMYDLYKQVSYLMIFNPSSLYRKIATPFKLFEYISFEKPIISSSGTFVSEFVKNNDIGYVVDYDANKLNKFLNNLPTLEEYIRIVENLKKVKFDNTWEKRAEKVAKTLTGITDTAQ